jgi:hypothetical protein
VRMVFRWTLCAAALTCMQPLHAEDSSEIVTRCIFDIGEFGAEAVDICVRYDVEARNALKDYPPEAEQLIAKCTNRMKGGGWAMVKRCVDRGLADGSSSPR